MKTITILAQPQPEAGWIHRYRNFGEDVYVRLKDTCGVDIAEIDAAVDEFHVGVGDDRQAERIAGVITELAGEHHLDDAVYVMTADEFTSWPAVILVLDVTFGERLWEVAGRHPTWVVGGDENRAAVEQMRRNREEITLWSAPFEVVTTEEWRQMLNTIDMHHGELASDPPMKRLSVYGATPTPAIIAALHDYEFECVKTTPSGFIALQHGSV